MISVQPQWVRASQRGASHYQHSITESRTQAEGAVVVEQLDTTGVRAFSRRRARKEKASGGDGLVSSSCLLWRGSLALAEGTRRTELRERVASLAETHYERYSLRPISRLCSAAFKFSQ